ncbi:MAG: hypothetical protein LUI06_00980 [Ruminococcus sp.]|nr:hypothetical protein [Ruminococcus sp.]
MIESLLTHLLSLVASKGANSMYKSEAVAKKRQIDSILEGKENPIVSLTQTSFVVKMTIAYPLTFFLTSVIIMLVALFDIWQSDAYFLGSIIFAAIGTMLFICGLVTFAFPKLKVSSDVVKYHGASYYCSQIRRLEIKQGNSKMKLCFDDGRVMKMSLDYFNAEKLIAWCKLCNIYIEVI